MKTVRALAAALTTLLTLVAVTAVSVTPAEAAPKGSKCKYFTDGPSSDHYKLCILVGERLSQSDKLVHSGFVENDNRRGKIEGKCESKVEETFRWGGSLSVTAEGKAWIFAKVSGTVTASFDKSRTTGYSVSSGFKVPAKSTKYCYYVERHERYRTVQCFTNAYTEGEQCQTKTFYAPQREGWVISSNPIKY